MTVTRAPRVAAVRPLDVASRWSRVVVVVALVAAAVLWLLPDEVSRPAVLVISGLGLLAGLPHGSIDHRVVAASTGRSMARVAAVYAVAAVLAWVLLTLVGPVAVVAVVVLSLVHFGSGELEVARSTQGWRPSGPVALAIAVAGSGALLLPLARSGDLLSDVAAEISPQLGALLGAGPVRLGLAGVWVVAAAVVLVAASRGHHRAAVWDVVLVGALGAFAPPLLAFAVWFGGWHGLRHCARLLDADPQASVLVADGRARDGVMCLVRQAAWPSLAAALTLAALVVFTAAAPDATSAMAATLVVLLALTVPHMLVVGWTDRQAARATR